MRETCAQTIGVILKHMDVEGVKRVMMVFLTLQAQTEWEVRHGGLLGLKYLLAVRQVNPENAPKFQNSFCSGQVGRVKGRSQVVMKL